MKFLVDLALENSHAWAGRETLVNLVVTGIGANGQLSQRNGLVWGSCHHGQVLAVESA